MIEILVKLKKIEVYLEVTVFHFYYIAIGFGRDGP